ncbi:MAG: hypothetical protein PWP19_1083 [Thermococcaceae archaeon]|nr:hypothetical protein [Thermococcaceae archaeon]
MPNNEILFKIKENERKSFANFVSRKTGIKNIDLVEWDYIIHTLLKELEKDPYFRENYIFKGGTCLVKCHLGYYRFSRDLDFAYRNSGELQEMSRSKLKKFLSEETGRIAETLNCVAKDLGLEFYYRDHNDFNNNRYFSFLIGPGWFREIIAYSPAGEKIKLEFNYAERFAFRPRTVKAHTLLSWKKSKLEVRDYEKYAEFLGNYYPLKLLAYQDKEILTEKVRAILTRREFKLRDLYDLYKLYQVKGLKLKKYKKQIDMKIENYLSMSNNARENFLKAIQELRREDYSHTLRSEIEKDIILIVEEFEKDKFLKFVESLRRELLEFIESGAFGHLIERRE